MFRGVVNKLLKEKEKNPPMTKKAVKKLQEMFYGAVMVGDIVTCQNCINKGIDPNMTFEEEQSAIHIAVEHVDLPLTMFLIKLPNLDINKTNFFGLTPLGIAVSFGKFNFIKLLIRYKADPNISSIYGRTPLHIAVLLQKSAIISYLVNHHADINAVDAFGNTPLSFAVIETCNYYITDYLLSKEANMNLQTVNPLNLFMELILNCHTDKQMNLVVLLLYYGADVNVNDRETNQNCLHFVAISNYVPAAHALLENGCKLNVRDRYGRSPIHVAKDHKNKEVLAVFYKWVIKKGLVEQCASVYCKMTLHQHVTE